MSSIEMQIMRLGAPYAPDDELHRKVDYELGGILGCQISLRFTQALEQPSNVRCGKHSYTKCERT